MSIANNLRQLIAERNLSIKDLAQGAGIPMSTLSQWANGKQEPKAEALWRLASYIGVSVEYLVTGKHPEERVIEDLVQETARRFVSIHQGTYRITVEKELQTPPMAIRPRERK